MEKSLIILKPDTVRRGLVGRVLSRLEDRGLKIADMAMKVISRELAEEHYKEHAGKPFFEDLVQFITSGPAVILLIEGKNAIPALRATMGSTNPLEALPGTIRGDFGNIIDANLIHGSDSSESAQREIELFFGGN